MSVEDYPHAFKFRLNCIDHYQATSTSLDVALPGRNGQEDVLHRATVPIIRIFGATETGQKVCAHVHGALPYLFVQYHGSLEQSQVVSFIHTFAASVNQALGYSYRRNAYEESLSSYVAHITLVKGVPFYGYHVGYRYYLKVYLRNPAHMTRFADLLHQGAIMGHVIQPHESHLQYLLQWMCDYNLYGCAIISCSRVQYRQPVPALADVASQGHRWHDASIRAEDLLDHADFRRQSHCSLEIDISLSDILNRHEVGSRPIHQDFNERHLGTLATQKYVPSMAGLWRDERQRRSARDNAKYKNVAPFPPEALVSMSAGSRDVQSSWIHEHTYGDMLQLIIAEECVEGSKVSFESLDLLLKDDFGIQTVIESVADLYPDRIGTYAFSLRLPLPAEVKPTLPVVDHTNMPKLSSAEPDGYFSDDDYSDSDPVLENGGISPSEDQAAVNPRERDISVSSQGRSRELPPSPTPMKDKPDGSSQLLPGTAPPAMISQPQVADQQSSTSILLHAKQEMTKSSASHAHCLVSPEKTDSLSIVPASRLHKHLSGHLQLLDQGREGTSHQVSGSSARASDVVKSEPDVHPASLNHHMPASNSARLFQTSHLSQDDALRSPRHQKFWQFPKRVLTIRANAPLPEATETFLIRSGQPTVHHQDAHYSHRYDDEKQAIIHKHLHLHDISADADLDFSRKSNALKPSNDGHTTGDAAANNGLASSFRVWRIATGPPTKHTVRRWLARRAANRPIELRRRMESRSRARVDTGLVGKRRRRTIRSKPHSIIETQYMSIMSLEVFACTRGDFSPDPVEDEISCVFWSLRSDTNSAIDDVSNGIIMVNVAVDSRSPRNAGHGTRIDVEDNELELINRVIDVVRDLDPDILIGYEVHNGSWGYLIERSRLRYEFDLCNDLSRVNFGSRGRFGKDADRWGFTHTSTIRITGRHMMNIWRAMRGELNLLQYTIENVAFRLLRIRIPHYTSRTLTNWYASGFHRSRNRVLDYFLTRTQLNIKIFQSVDMVAKTSEQARLLGVDFFSVISRGSQFKVESLMFRIAKPENFVLISPSRKQVGQQNALECLPLVMEPRSNFYSSPVLVLDFQSLYPSIMIAYNYCYSTCLGRVAGWRGQNKLGVVDYSRPPRFIELLRKELRVAPNGLIFVRPHIRKSLLAKMLTEILETRIMVKTGMKEDRKDRVLQRLLNNRQLALKLIANVTYGYTSASFSGRLPCAEIADSIVQSGRETLEKAIALIHSVDKWGAEVVYGDTDSLFVHLKGKSREQAFSIGQDIADTITKANPRPIKLKFEKVYHPCVLLAKKRYVGFKYDRAGQEIPEFDAKGIETVRRDGTPAEQRIEEKALRILFRTQDLSRVRNYFQQECLRIMTGNINIQDFLFAKEVKLGTYSDKGPGPPGALVATRKMIHDRRLEPQYGERVPYVVIAGAPGARLIDRCVDPEVLLHDDQAELDADYYITKNLIPPLERIFGLMGANVKAWYEEMPKFQYLRTSSNLDPALLRTLDLEEHNANKRTLETYLRERACLVCCQSFHGDVSLEEPEHSDSMSTRVSSTDEPSLRDDARVSLPELRGLVCVDCITNASQSVFALRSRLRGAQQRVQNILNVCRDCSGLSPGEPVHCESRDCPTYYCRVRDASVMSSLSPTVHLISRWFDQF